MGVGHLAEGRPVPAVHAAANEEPDESEPLARRWDHGRHVNAHLITPNHGHDAAWRAAITALGRPAEAERMRRRRKPLTSGA